MLNLILKSAIHSHSLTFDTAPKKDPALNSGLLLDLVAASPDSILTQGGLYDIGTQFLVNP